MKKVKSGLLPAEATRKAGPARKGATKVATRKGAGSSAARKSEARATSRKAVGRRRAKAAPAGKVATKQRAGSAARGARGARATVAKPVLQIRKLDPMRICGDRTSVIQLFRVDEAAVAVGKAAGSRQVHLVFNDRHGWYCEHGRSCHAVSAVMRHAGIR
jgi:hypothetical protein